MRVRLISVLAGLLLLLAGSAGIGMAHATASTAACTRSISTSGSTYSVQITVNQSCGTSFRAVLFAGGTAAPGYHYGTYTKINGNHSVACIISTCGSSGSSVLWGGWQRKDTGVIRCTYHCASGIVHRYTTYGTA